MEFLKSKPENKEEIKKLWAESFNDNEDYVDYWFEGMYKPENTYICISDNKIIASLQTFPNELITDGNAQNAVFVCGFCVSRDERGQGIGTKLLDYALTELKAQGYDLMFLSSDADEFYLKYGLNQISKKEYIEYIPAEHDEIKVNASGNLIDALKAYNTFTSDKRCYVKRGIGDFLHIAATGMTYNGDIKVFYTPDKPDCYVIYFNEGDVMYIDEMAYINDYGKNSIDEFIKKSGKKKVMLLKSQSLFYKGLNKEYCIDEFKDCFIFKH